MWSTTAREIFTKTIKAAMSSSFARKMAFFVPKKARVDKEVVVRGNKRSDKAKSKAQVPFRKGYG